MITQEERILLFAALFHDIGKFEQRCTNRHVPHQELGAQLIDEFKMQINKILGDGNPIDQVKNLIMDHHNRDKSYNLLNILKFADYLSASERVDFNEEDDFKDKWSHKFLSSLYSKIYLNSKDVKKTRYYEHKELSKKDYNTLVPAFESEEDLKSGNHTYTNATFNKFKSELKSVLEFYEDDEDFQSFINLILILFEKYMWCIPDFTGSDVTDISLFNHIKDVAGISHAILKSDNSNENKLNLIIGDLPGIQKYIFNVSLIKPAKVLRGRSIYVQILIRQFAAIFLRCLGLTEANLIMFAGGKFYILAQESENFKSLFDDAKNKIDSILIENFKYQLSFSAAYQTFDYNSLKNGQETFGGIIDKTSYKLNQQRNKQFSSVLFGKNSFNENNFILDADYVKRDGDSDKVKCAVTGLPINMGREEKLPDTDGDEIIDRQVLNEIRIGQNIPKSNVVVEFSENYDSVLQVEQIKSYKQSDQKVRRILLNPELDELLKKENLKKEILRNTFILEVANYTSTTVDENKRKNNVMEFDQMEDLNNGAKFMTLIKGDVDNLGLIMSLGLFDDQKNLTAISRTTTLSNHLKYFFSFSLNGFLTEWERGEYVKKTVDDGYINDQKVYTVFAGGDDLMLVCPQSSSLKLVEALNNTFNNFVCNNKEVHISYSLTNFKHNTPIRIVADMAEQNQKDAKSDLMAKDMLKRIDYDNALFNAENDKAAIKLFDTSIKNNLINNILTLKKDLVKWEKDENNKVSQGVLRNLLYFAKIMQDYERTKDTQLLMWHPKLNYMINRVLKKNNSEYHNPEIEPFFEKSLMLNKKDSAEDIVIEQILYPVICETIYGTRNS